jgi:hypothetical protein
MVRLTLMLLACWLGWGSDAGAIIGGAADGTGHPYVAAIGQPDGEGIVFTGTAISDTVILTVAHGAVRLMQATGSNQARVTFDPVADPSSTWYTGTIHIDPAFNPNVLGAGDYAVIVFPTQLPVTPAVLPQRNALARMSQLTLRATPEPLTGYGMTALLAGTPNPDFSSGGTRKIDVAAFRALKPQHLKLQLPDGDQVCVGDSGAPSLFGGTNVITGIDLGALGGCISSGTIIQMRVDTDAARAFVGQFVQLP